MQDKVYLFAFTVLLFFLKLPARNGSQINHINFCIDVISSKSKQENRPVLPDDGGSTSVMISCIGIKEVHSRLGLKNWAAGPFWFRHLMFTSQFSMKTYFGTPKYCSPS